MVKRFNENPTKIHQLLYDPFVIKEKRHDEIKKKV